MIVFPIREKIAGNKQYPEAILHTLDVFYKIVYHAQWQTLQEVKQIFPSAQVLKDGNIIFDLASEYQLVIQINLDYQAIHVLYLESYGKLTEILLNSLYLKKV